jgi:hypothetical protein
METTTEVKGGNRRLMDGQSGSRVKATLEYVPPPPSPRGRGVSFIFQQGSYDFG